MSEELVVRLDATDHVIKIQMSDPDTLIPVMILAERGADGVDGSSASRFVHQQLSAATEWIVNHNLGRKPGSEVLSFGGQKVGALVLHFSANQLRVYFNLPQVGEVICL